MKNKERDLAAELQRLQELAKARGVTVELSEDRRFFVWKRLDGELICREPISQEET